MSKKNGSKTQESPQQQYIPPQRGQRDSTDTAYEDAYDDLIAFIYNWIVTFIFCVFLSSMIIGITVEGFLSSNYDKTFWVSALVLCVLFLVTIGSARLALIEYPEFLTFIFKWAGITSYYFVAILSGILLWGNDLSYMSLTNVFWKIAPWICILWMISIISTGITWFMTYDRQNTKMVLLDFVSFILKQASVFYLLLAILGIAISYNGSFLGIYFDETFGKFLISMCYILIVGAASGYIALFTNASKWVEYNTGVTWQLFTTKIIAPRKTEFHAE